MEQEKLALNDPIKTHLPTDLEALLTADGYDTSAITVAMLLNHTSGIADFFSMPGWIDTMVANPERQWTRKEQIAFTTEQLDPIAKPGTVYAYSDTGYILAGAIIEQVTKASLDQALRDLLRLTELGLKATGIEGAAALSTTPRAVQTLNNVDGWGIDPSVDAFGAGGLVTTSTDLALFFGALASDTVFDSEHTLTLMLTPSPQSLVHDPDGYGLGVSLARVRSTKCFGHGGFWGVLALACPGTGVAAAGMVTDPSGQAALKDQIGASVWVSLGSE
jgi:D-alanyl-D-alanine carboxypeptidase